MKLYEEYVNEYQKAHQNEPRRVMAKRIIEQFLIDNGISEHYRSDEETLFKMYDALKEYPESEQKLFVLESITAKSPLGLMLKEGKEAQDAFAEWYGFSL